MKAEELRIGNWVLSLGKDGIWYNSKISKIEVQNIIVGVGFKRQLKPIPLSEDILLKCGFVGRWYPGEDFICFNAKLNKCQYLLSHQQFRIERFIIRDIKHLHQLQNLYYALTGQELEINL